MTWDHGGSNSYRMGAEGKYDLKLAPGQCASATSHQKVFAPESLCTSGPDPVGCVTFRFADLDPLFLVNDLRSIIHYDYVGNDHTKAIMVFVKFNLKST